MKQPFLLPFLFYLDFKQFSSVCVDKLYTTAVWGAAPVFYIFYTAFLPAVCAGSLLPL